MKIKLFFINFLYLIFIFNFINSAQNKKVINPLIKKPAENLVPKKNLAKLCQTSLNLFLPASLPINSINQNYVSSELDSLLSEDEIKKIQQVYCYLEFLTKIELVNSGFQEFLKTKKDNKYSIYYKDYKNYMINSDSATPNLPNAAFIETAAWRNLKISQKDLQNSTAWQFILKSFAADSYTTLELLLSELQYIRNSEFEYLLNIETQYHNQTFSELLATEKIINLKILCEEKNLFAYKKAIVDWSTKSDSELVKLILNFKESEFYNITHDLKLWAKTDSNRNLYISHDLKTPMKEFVYCFFAFVMIEKLISSKITQENLADFLAFSEKTLIKPNLFNFQTDDFALFYSYLSSVADTTAQENLHAIAPQLPKTAEKDLLSFSNLNSKLHGNVENQNKVTANVATKEKIINNKGIENNIINKNLNIKNKQNDKVKVQGFLSFFRGIADDIKDVADDAIHGFEKAGEDIVSGIETSAEAMWHLTKAAGYGLLGVGSELVGYALGIPAVITYGKHFSSYAVDQVQDSETDIVKSINDFGNALKNGVEAIAPIIIMGMLGPMSAFIFADKTLMNQTLGVFDAVTNILFSSAESIEDAMVKYSINQEIILFKVSESFADLMASTVLWEIHPKETFEASESFVSSVIHAVTGSFSNVWALAKTEFFAIMQCLAGITNQVTTTFIDIVSDASFLVVSAVTGSFNSGEKAFSIVSKKLNQHRMVINNVLNVVILAGYDIGSIILTAGANAPAVVAEDAIIETSLVAAEDGMSAVAESAATAVTEDTTSVVGEDALTTASESSSEDTSQIAAEQVIRNAARTAARATTVVENGAELVAENGSEDVAKTVSEEAVKNAAKDAAKTALKDGAKAAAKNAIKQLGKNASEQAMRDASKDAITQFLKTGAEDVAKTAAKQAAKETTESFAKGVSENIAKETAESTTQEVAADLSETAEKEGAETTEKSVNKVDDALKKAMQKAAKKAMKAEAKRLASSVAKSLSKDEIENLVKKAGADAAKEVLKNSGQELSDDAANDLAENVASDGLKSMNRATKIIKVLSGGFKLFGEIINFGFMGLNIYVSVQQTESQLKQENNIKEKIEKDFLFSTTFKKEYFNESNAYVKEITNKKNIALINENLLSLSYYQNLLNANSNLQLAAAESSFAESLINYLTPIQNFGIPADIGFVNGCTTEFLNFNQLGCATVTLGRPDFPYSQEVAAPEAETNNYLWYINNFIVVKNEEQINKNEKAIAPLVVHARFNIIYTLDGFFSTGIFVGGEYNNYRAQQYLNNLQKSGVANVNFLNSAKFVVLFRESKGANIFLGVYDVEISNWIFKKSLSELNINENQIFDLIVKLDDEILSVEFYGEENKNIKATYQFKNFKKTSQQVFGFNAYRAAVEWNILNPKLSIKRNENLIQAVQSQLQAN